jgi:regulator of protease activity HflC (stomatin/prohibitin superfamily)
MDFSDAFEQAVEEKMIAEQNKLKADYENEKKVATAKANAEAKILEAEAEAKSNELLEKSITDKTLRDKYLDKWDGKLPSTMVGEDTMLMVPAA